LIPKAQSGAGDQILDGARDKIKRAWASSSVGFKVDFDMALLVLASGLYRRMASRMRGYDEIGGMVVHIGARIAALAALVPIYAWQLISAAENAGRAGCCSRQRAKLASALEGGLHAQTKDCPGNRRQPRNGAMARTLGNRPDNRAARFSATRASLLLHNPARAEQILRMEMDSYLARAAAEASAMTVYFHHVGQAGGARDFRLARPRLVRLH
jgi:hypothetical protein